MTISQGYNQANPSVMEPSFALSPTNIVKGAPKTVLRDPTIVMTYIAYVLFLFTKLTWRVRSHDVIDTNDFIDLNAMVNIMTQIACFAVIVLTTGWTKYQYRLLVRGPALLFTIFLTMACSSILWSSYIQLSAYRASSLLVAVVIALSFVSRANTWNRVVRLLLLTSITAVIYWIIQRLIFVVLNKEKTYVDFEVMMATWRANFGGAAAAVVCIIAITMILRPKSERQIIYTTIISFIGIFGMVLFRSSSSLVCLEFGLAVLLLYHKRYFLLFITAIIMTTGLLMAPSRRQVEKIIFVGKEAKSVRTWTGRVGMWIIVRRMIISSPVLGYGYGTAERKTLAQKTQQSMGHSWSNSHNGYYGGLLATGLTGGIPLIGSFAYMWYIYIMNFIRSGASPGRGPPQSQNKEFAHFNNVILGTLSVLTLNNITVPGIVGEKPTFMIVVFVMVCLAVTKQYLGGFESESP